MITLFLAVAESRSVLRFLAQSLRLVCVLSANELEVEAEPLTLVPAYKNFKSITLRHRHSETPSIWESRLLFRIRTLIFI